MAANQKPPKPPKTPPTPPGKADDVAPADSNVLPLDPARISHRFTDMEIPPEVLALQEREAAERKAGGQKPEVNIKGGRPVTGKEVTPEELKKFIRGEITLAQLEGFSREQLYYFAELGYTMFKSGRLDEACKIFEGLVMYNPYDGYFHSALGAIYQKLKRYEEAIKQYDLAVRFNPKDTCSYTNRGETYLLLGNLNEAQSNFKKAIDLDPEQKDPWSQRSRALVIAVNNALNQKT